MAKAKKNGTYLNVCIESQIYERLERMCEAAGQSKTTAVERALTRSDIMQGIENLRRSFPILSSAR